MRQEDVWMPLQKELALWVSKEAPAANEAHRTPDSPWSRLIHQLQGDLAQWPTQIDDLDLAAYLAGMATPQEQAHVEQALAEVPCHQMVLQVVQEVLTPSICQQNHRTSG
ncbi:MAG: hypothetical protein NZ602_01670 [Thermoguttaceae bacterium]|nr:hypothetical protein [Thermoguttaceae bacterium]MDW8038479.1 hypothetical protein [Thermoguttaceae bacterium]